MLVTSSNNKQARGCAGKAPLRTRGGKRPWHEGKVLPVAPSLGVPVLASSGGFAGSAQGGQRGTKGAVGSGELFMLRRWHCEPCIN